jgi:hypothetical protein
MVRVEWSALSGDDVEAVLSNLLYNAHPRALRIRPSQGDYGIDVIVPTETGPQTWDVYQIKKFAQNLTANQKGQIERSFRRVLVGLVRRGVPLNDWYLVTPLDPTIDNLLDWFSMLPEQAIETLANDEDLRLTSAEIARMRGWLEAPGRVLDWKGLDFCQQLSSQYPYVVDYYVHGGRDRLRDAVSDIAQLLGRDATLRERDAAARQGEGAAALMQPAEIREHLTRLNRVLDTDPHFRYGHSLDLHRPELKAEPGLVAATQESTPEGWWLTFKIYERSAQSLDERPIPLELEFNFEGSSEDREAFEVWRKYGKPFEATASVKAGLPGGLHADSKAGRVRLSPAEGESTTFRNRLRIVDPDGAVLAELRFEVTSTRGEGGAGFWAHGVDDSGTLETESFIDTATQGGTINFRIRPLAGLEANKALAPVTFASKVMSPNVLQVAAEYGPFREFTPLPSSEPLVPPAVARIVGALATIQTQISSPVRIPDFASMDPPKLKAIRRAASLIDGHTVVEKWTDLSFDKREEVDLDPDGHYQIQVLAPLVVPINGEDLTVGTVELTTLSARVDANSGEATRVVPNLNDTLHARFVPGTSSTLSDKVPVRYREAHEVRTESDQGDGRYLTGQRPPLQHGTPSI